MRLLMLALSLSLLVGCAATPAPAPRQTTSDLDVWVTTTTLGDNATMAFFSEANCASARTHVDSKAAPCHKAKLTNGQSNWTLWFARYQMARPAGATPGPGLLVGYPTSEGCRSYRDKAVTKGTLVLVADCTQLGLVVQQ